MAEITNSREIRVGERRVTVRELTVAEVRQWLGDASSRQQIDTVDAMLFEDISLPDLARMTSLDVDSMGDWQPSQLREVIAAAKDMNKDFFALRERIVSAFLPTQPEN
ncbi:hypothetical protein [Metapseudomonas resinovorans]|uniref:hypothetical protein n=1 Tax=Metapseudomonas resinovorans TaxID=53412 RepID=UPI0012DBE135|nr:hypothetical protein [Pseudomonas resinovorans]